MLPASGNSHEPELEVLYSHASFGERGFIKNASFGGQDEENAWGYYIHDTLLQHGVRHHQFENGFFDPSGIPSLKDALHESEKAPWTHDISKDMPKAVGGDHNGHDVFQKIPTEVLTAVLPHLSSGYILNLRLASRAFATLSLP
ncbi:hypothetical protein AJ79_03801 [Helicocarpus griseus UAMH5409]|uniref:F-box domain-containing protein n=1 Tax=Helicocarpus griseus UAMH5409 TaxID=1447875 RepID=A0A2B7XX88_9EURO|nr:hypothetical protein AJ79_03801 [Helicocarpus griseus UAMH5409]